MKAAVFFDAGGTLVHIDHVRVGEAVRRATGRVLDLARFTEAEYAARDHVERAINEGKAPTDRSRWGPFFDAILSCYGIPEEELGAITREIIAEHRRAHIWNRVIPGTAEALAALREAGYVIGCVSNSDGAVEQLLADCGLRRHLAVVVDSGVVGVEKPDPQIFRIALDRTGVEARDAWYVGDIHAIDVVGAQRAGLEPILLDPLGRYADRGCRTSPDVPTLARALVTSRRAA